MRSIFKFISIFLFLLSSLSIFAQEQDSTSVDSLKWQPKGSIFFGTGFPQFINTGLRLQYNDKSQIGFLVSHHRENNAEDKVTTIALEHFSYFGKQRDTLSRPEWYFRANFTYLSINLKEFSSNSNFLGLEFALGKDLLIKNIGGLGIDLGFLSIIYYIEADIDPLLPVYPTVKFQFFLNALNPD
ncbi:MAG: hypothetical protein JKX95_02320 [Bacteroidia bacterium]|nr:hypothetical protein [Bacteroidia bacterium]